MLAFLTSSLHFVLLVLLPLVGAALAALLLVYGAYVRWYDAPSKWSLAPRALHALLALALLGLALLVLQQVLAHNQRQTHQDSAAVRASRERFVLPADFQYGELLVPAGTLVNRRDPFDQGEPGRALALHGLQALRFGAPVQIAGVWANALQVTPARLELAQDQVLGPVYHITSPERGWERHRIKSTAACKKGQLAVFHVPHITYDVAAELDRPPPDGAQARFAPSQWLFRYCENAPPINLEPARAAP